MASNVSVITDYRDKRRKSISARTGKRLGADAVRIELAALSQVFVWAMECKVFTHNPLSGIRRKRGPKTERRLEPDESVNLKLLAERAESDQHRTVSRFLLTQLELYCRPGELAQLRVSDIRLASRDCILRNTKNGTTRIVHMSPTAVELVSVQLVQAALSDSPYLFHTVSKAGTLVPYNYAWPVRQFKKLGYVGADFKAHVMRKEALSRGLESGLELGVMQHQSGHGTLEGVEQYRVNLTLHDRARDALDEHSRIHLLDADADVNNQLPPALALARAQHLFDALPPDVQAKFLASFSQKT
ncbi:hypothetical protein CSZ94_27190 [Janthinobacterium sp. ROICE36]|nr:hypothetical protein CSZ94_27190 [Janthinobacterium sp. ROICE36]